MPFKNGVPLPHEGRARYPVPDSHIVIIDIDSEHIAFEVPKQFLDEMPFTVPTLTIGAGDLRFFYYLKTPKIMRLLNSWDVRMN